MSSDDEDTQTDITQAEITPNYIPLEESLTKIPASKNSTCQRTTDNLRRVKRLESLVSLNYLLKAVVDLRNRMKDLMETVNSYKTSQEGTADLLDKLVSDVTSLREKEIKRSPKNLTMLRTEHEILNNKLHAVRTNGMMELHRIRDCFNEKIAEIQSIQKSRYEVEDKIHRLKARCYRVLLHKRKLDAKIHLYRQRITFASTSV